MPAIRIIIPVYNQAQALSFCLESISKQDFSDYEIIVVNDGSKDNVDSVCANWSKRIPVHLVTQNNRGAPSARNRGAENASTEYLLFCDADVKLHKNFLKKTYLALANDPKASFCYTSFMYGWKFFRLMPFNRRKLEKNPYIHTTSLIRRKYFPGFDESLKRFQDWDLFLSMTKNGGYGIYIPEILFSIEPKGTMSTWLPKGAIKLLPFLPLVKKYRHHERIIKEKHGLL